MKIRRVIEIKWGKVRSQGVKGPRVQKNIPQNNHLNPRTLESWNPNGFTLIETILVIVIIAILAAVVIPRAGFDISPRVSVEGAAYMIASDIRYVQECAMANRVSKSVNFVSGASTYTFPATVPSTSNLDPSGRLPSGVTIGTTITITFNSLGEPTTGAASVTVSGGGGPKTISVVNYTGKVNIL